jgi:hypothetical protein
MKALFLIASVAALAVGQAAGGSIEGTWTAEFERRTFIRLELKTVNGKMVGGISMGNFAVDAQGGVSRADAAPRDLKPISDVRLSGSTVTFSLKEGDDEDEFVLRLGDNAGAELQILPNEEDRKEMLASGLPLPKPIRMTKGG